MAQTERLFCIYSRKSKFTGKGKSIENQIELCRQYLLSHFPEAGLHEVLLYEDEGFSGKNMERPQFQKMLKDVRANKIGCIVCYSLDRISRNVSDFSKLIEELNYRKISFISIKQQFDTTTPMGRAMMYIASVFSQLERETTAERIRDNMHELAKTGRWLGGITPTGYRSSEACTISVDGRKRKAFHLDFEESEVPLVKLIFSKFLETQSLVKTEAYLLQTLQQTKNGKDFTRFAVKNILLNPVYVKASRQVYEYFSQRCLEVYARQEEFDGAHGLMVYNRTNQSDGKNHFYNDISEWIVAVGQHRGLIDGEDWIRAQELLQKNRAKSFKKGRCQTALLSGLLICKNCGHYMRPKMSARVNSEGVYPYAYVCSMKERSKKARCSMKNAEGIALDAGVLEAVKQLGFDMKSFLAELEEGERKIRADAAADADPYDALQSRILENENAIHGLVQSLPAAAGTASEKYILEQIEKLDQKNQELRGKSEELRRERQEDGGSGFSWDWLTEKEDGAGAVLDAAAVAQKSRLIRRLVKKIVWDGETAVIQFFAAEEIQQKAEIT